MKKLLSFAVAFALAVTSLGATTVLAADRTVKVPLTVVLDNGDGYQDTTEDKPCELEYSETQFDAKATIDMSAVKTQWNDYIALALKKLQAINPSATKADVLNAVDLSGSTFKVSVGVPAKIVNEAEPAHKWNDNVEKLFKEVDWSYEDNTYTINMKIKDGVTNANLDAYFNDTELAELSLTFEDNEVTSVGKRKIVSTFSGEIKIDISALSYSAVIKIDSDPDTDWVYRKSSGGGGGGGGGVIKPSPTPTTDPSASPSPTPTTEPSESPEPTATPEVPEEIATTVEPQLGGTSSGAKLEYEDHYAYIIGYDAEDGTQVVRPENNITRAEVATIFFRLLTEESRQQFSTKANDFADVNEGDWFNNNVSTVAAAGIVNGYEDGTFGPNKNITRAEFAAIAARFTQLVYEGESIFTDTNGHWAEDAINNAAFTGWISGYDDGSFNPEAYITRAEAITMINRVLYRYVQKNDIHNESTKWADNTEDKWYYEAVQEATNSHDYKRKDIGYYEAQTSTFDAYDWESYEK